MRAGVGVYRVRQISLEHREMDVLMYVNKEMVRHKMEGTCQRRDGGKRGGCLNVFKQQQTTKKKMFLVIAGLENPVILLIERLWCPEHSA